MKSKENLSRFFITLNTNQTDYDKTRLKNVIDDFYDNMELFLKYKDGKGTIDNVREINLQAGLEEGTKQGRQHCHMLVTIKHNTKLHIDIELARSFFTEELGLPSVHLNCQYIQSNIDNILKYIEKGKFKL